VDGQPVVGFSLEQVVSKLRGRPGSSVAIEITRQNEPAPIEKRNEVTPLDGWV
jgi:C-terminal processing protease CtpA/Prc